jgi:3-oxoacyl-[acyl-carrier protein] reductase
VTLGETAAPSLGLAIVTGASQGIGRGVAERLVRDGWDLALVARRADVLETVARELRATGRVVSVHPCDIADGDAVAAAVEAIAGEHHRVDALVNNAGITRDALLVRMRTDQWRDVMAINLDGAYHCLRAVAPVMMRARWGRIVNVTSVIGQIGNAGQANYAASKAGLIGLTMSAARELAGRGVTVNAVAPGFIETAMTEALSEKSVAQLKSQIPMQRLGNVEDVAAVVSFLLSPGASYLTGQVINCDGGMVMG